MPDAFEPGAEAETGMVPWTTHGIAHHQPVDFDLWHSDSERLQKFNQIGFLCPCEIQREQPVIVVDHRQEIRCAAVVKVRWMLPESS